MMRTTHCSKSWRYGSPKLSLDVFLVPKVQGCRDMAGIMSSTNNLLQVRISISRKTRTYVPCLSARGWQLEHENLPTWVVETRTLLVNQYLKHLLCPKTSQNILYMVDVCCLSMIPCFCPNADPCANHCSCTGGTRVHVLKLQVVLLFALLPS